jgi:hypothetical protein
MRRSGATLVEVLVAIFVMGIGLIAVLALFPLGVIRMAQAIQDGRTAQIALNADAVSVLPLFNVRHDATFMATCQNPGGGLTKASFPGPSYPVFIDPIGYRNAAATGYQSWLAGTAGTIPRISSPYVTSDAIALRWFSLQDDILFGTSGLPQYVPPTPPYTFERAVRYSWGYMCQLPKVADNSVVNMAVVVFNRRSLGMGAGGLPLNEYYYQSSYDTTRNVVTVTVPAGGTPPPLRPGEWILDCTQVAGPPASAHGYFYRVVSLTDNGNSTFDIEVQTPFRGFSSTPGTYAGQTIILEGVAEVFERGDGRVP